MIQRAPTPKRKAQGLSALYDVSPIVWIALVFLATWLWGGDPDDARERRAALQRGVDNVLGGFGVPEVVLQYGGIDDDPEVNERMQAIFAPIAKEAELHRSDLRYNISVLRSKVPNAFSLPGGRTFITRGLIELLESDDEVAGVMGHELAHTIKSHGTKAFGRDLGLILLYDFVLDHIDERDRKDAAELAQLSFALVSTGYSRAAETEADAFGLMLAARAGYDPLGLAEALKKIEAYQREHRDPLREETPVYFRTHPLTSDRVRDIYQEARALGYEVEEFGDPLLDGIRNYNQRVGNQPVIQGEVQLP